MASPPRPHRLDARIRVPDRHARYRWSFPLVRRFPSKGRFIPRRGPFFAWRRRRHRTAPPVVGRAGASSRSSRMSRAARSPTSRSPGGRCTPTCAAKERRRRLRPKRRTRTTPSRISTLRSPALPVGQYHGPDHEHHAETLERHRADPAAAGTRGRSPGPSHRPERLYLHYLLLHVDRLSESGLRYLLKSVEEEIAHREPHAPPPAAASPPPLPETPVP